MATIIRRKSKDGKLTYLVRIRRKGNVAQTATFHSLKDAKKYAQITEGAILEGRHFHVKEATKHPLGDMIAHRSLILEACLKIWKFSLQRENDVEV